MGEPSVNSYKKQRQFEDTQIDKILPYYMQHLSIIPDRTQACEVFDFTFEHKSQIYKVEEKFRKCDYISIAALASANRVSPSSSPLKRKKKNSYTIKADFYLHRA